MGDNNSGPFPSIKVQHSYSKSMNLTEVDDDARVNDFWNVAKANGKDMTIIFKHLSAEQCRRHIEELIKRTEEFAIGYEYDRQCVVFLDSCTFNSICLYLLGRWSTFGAIHIGIKIGITCKFVSYTPNPEEDLVACFSRTRLTSVEVILVNDPEEAVHDIWDNAKVYIKIVLKSGHDQEVDTPMEFRDLPLVASPVLQGDPVANGTRIMCREALLLTAALQAPTLMLLETNPFHPNSPFFLDGYITALTKRPVGAKPLELSSTPVKSEFAMRILPIFNEKNLTVLPIVLEPAGYATAAGMLQQALMVIETSLHICEVKYDVQYSAAIDHTLFFMRGLRKVYPRLRAPVFLTIEAVRLVRMGDQENAQKLTELNRLVGDMRKIQKLLGHRDMKNFVLMLCVKLPNVVSQSSLRMLSNDILRILHGYIIPKF